MPEKISFNESKKESENKNPEIIELLKKVKTLQPEKYEDNMSLDSEEAIAISHSFMDELLQSVNGHSGLSYYFDKKGWDVSEIEEWNLKYRPEEIEEEIVAFLESKVKNEGVLDLGCGIKGVGYILADYLRAAGYVGVEMNLAESANTRCNEIKGNTPFVIAQEDMGNFMKFFRDNNLKVKTIILSGIDKDSYTGHIPYDQLLHYINDSLEEDGILIVGGNIGSIMEEEREELDKIFKRSNVDVGGFLIYEKQKMDNGIRS